MTTPTTDDIAGLLGRTLTDAELAQAETALRFATIAVAAYLPDLSLGVVTNDTVKIHGTFARDLRLPKRPVLDVSTVAINGVELDASAWTWNGGDTIRRGGWYPEDVDRLGWDVTHGAVAGPVFHWGGPNAVIEVTYSHGVASLPEPIWLVIVQAARRMFLNPEGVKQESLGGYSVTYDSGDAGAGLNPSEVALLRQYRTRAR